jgi:ATP-dependent Clp protease protease subunit
MATVISAFNDGVRDFHLMISTTGGGVMNGITVFNFLTSLPIRSTTYNTGNVDSIGNVIFLAGERRIASPSSTFMFHGVAFNTTSPTALAERNLMEMLTVVRADQARMANIISERTQIPRPVVEHMFTEAATKNSTEALAVGIVHEIATPVVPVGAQVVLIANGQPQASGR